MNRYILKRKLASMSGILDWKWKHIQPGLYAFNFHRIGKSDDTKFDPNIFTCDEAQFSQYIEILKSRFRIIDIKQLVALIETRSVLTQPLAMITFDDGYEDNFTRAFPVLSSLQTPAIFFLPTSYIGSQKIPWWDEAAWIVKHSNKKAISLPGLASPITIHPQQLKLSIRNVLRYFKDNETWSIDEKIVFLRKACEKELDVSVTTSLFMNWDQVRIMHESGMDIGSHTCSHQILSHLDENEQLKELSESKRKLEAEIGDGIDALAYPVGGGGTFSSVTKSLAQKCGYKLAFSFPLGGGVIRDPSTSKFEIPRLAPGESSLQADIQFNAVFANKY